MDFFTSIENESANIFKDPNSNVTFISAQTTGQVPSPGFGNAPQQGGNPFRSSTMPMRSQNTGMNIAPTFNTMNSLQPQMTGIPSPSMSSPNSISANPFRASTMPFPITSSYANNSMQASQQPSFTGMNAPIEPQMTSISSQPTGLSPYNTPMQQMQGTGMMNLQPQTNMFTGASTLSRRMSVNPFMQQPQPQQQPQQQSFFGDMQQQSQMNNNANPFASGMVQQPQQQQAQMTGQTHPANFQQWTPTF